MSTGWRFIGMVWYHEMALQRSAMVELLYPLTPARLPPCWRCCEGLVGIAHPIRLNPSIKIIHVHENSLAILHRR